MIQTPTAPIEYSPKSVSEHFCRYTGFIALKLDQATPEVHIERQIITELAESIDAEMGTHNKPIQLCVKDNELCDYDGRNMTESAEHWSVLQSIRAQHNPNLEWFANIARIEAQEHKDIVEFAANANTGDVLVVISPFPEEAYACPETSAVVASEGFRPDLRRSFIRAYEKTIEGLEEHIQSIDTSSLDAWNITLGRFKGAQPATHTSELLAQRSVISGSSGVEVIEHLAATYDLVLYETTNAPHRYGRSPGSLFEANAFVRSHPEIIRDTIAELHELQAEGRLNDTQVEKIFYDSKALLSKILKAENTYSPGSVREERQYEGAAASARGDVFYGCSGGSTVVHAESTSMQIGMNRCVNCPYCKQEVTAYVSLSGSVECLSCKAKVNNRGMRIDTRANQSKPEKKEKDFVDLLIDLFFGQKKSTVKPGGKN